MQKPPGVGKPARASTARFAAFAPTRSGSVAAGAERGRMKRVMQLSALPGSRRTPSPRLRGETKSPHVIAVARERIDDGNLFDREIGDDFDRVLVHDQHFLNAPSVMEFFSMLGFERKRPPLFVVHRMIGRPDARDDRRIVLRWAEP